MATAILLVALAAQAIGLPSVSGPAVPIVPAGPQAVDAGRAHSSGTSPRFHPGDAPKRPRHQISGTASWFATGRNGLYAAACRPLRRVLGRGQWRGRHILVAHGRKAVEVTLNDWCGSHTKLIDLSDEVFRYFAPLSRGVLKVTVGW